MKQKRTKQEIIKELQHYYEEYGERPKAKLANTAAFSFSRRRVITVFESWNNALLASGIPINKSFDVIMVNCLECDKPIQRNHSRIQKNGKKQFCSVACSNIWRGKRTKKKEKTCPVCEKKFTGRNKHCGTECYKVARTGIRKDATLKECIAEISWIGVCRRIRTQARYIMEKQGIPKKCVFCEYDIHVECCHKKAVSEFSQESKFSEINAMENLVYLCPNHHWEFDNKLLTLD